MKTEYKWIKFEEIETKNKTKIFNILTIDDSNLLGQIKWFGAFRKYSFFPNQNTVFEKDCLLDIIKFIDQLTLLRKLEKETQI